jgi:hypothetical protein
MWYNYYNGRVLLLGRVGEALLFFILPKAQLSQLLIEQMFGGGPPSIEIDWGAAPFAAPFRGLTIGGTAPYAIG